MDSWLHPGLVIGLGGVLVPFIPWPRVKLGYFLLLPLIGLTILVSTSMGVFGTVPQWPEALYKGNLNFLHYSLNLVRINKLSLLFGYVYVIAAFCMNIYALRVKNHWEHVAAMIYVGSALGAVFAGDFFTLFFCLEIMSWAPFFLLLFRGTRKAMGAAVRYILWHHFSGLCILAGILIHAQQSGSIEFVHMPWGWGSKYLGSNLMLLGFVVNAATTPFHSWLSDTYSEATPSGSVYMTAYTTKTAIFCLIITFSGVPLLMWMGAIQAVFALFLAVLENDGRRLCSYHIISQIGYMVAGVGMGTAMGVNGAASHALCHIIYNALLYMGAGCALVVVGTAKFNELGGLYKYMPISFWLYMVGGFSISGFPLFNGFISKAMTIEAAELIQHPVIYLLLEGATVGTFLHTGLKLPWNIWLQGRDEPPSKIRAKLKDSALNTPVHMLVGMAILAFLCIFLGVYPKILYDMLPYPVEYVPFTVTRVFSITQMFIFAFLGFWVLRKLVRGYPSYVIDTDWLVRVPGNWFLRFCRGSLVDFGVMVDRQINALASSFVGAIRHPGIANRLTPMAMGVGLFISLLLLAVFLILVLTHFNHYP